MKEAEGLLKENMLKSKKNPDKKGKILKKGRNNLTMI